MQSRWRSAIDEQCGEEQRQPPAGDHLHVRKLPESIGNEAEQETCKDRRYESIRRHARQHARAVRREGEAEEDGDVVDGQGSEAQRVERQAKKRDANKMLAVRQRKFRRIENRRVGNVERLADRAERKRVLRPHCR